MDDDVKAAIERVRYAVAYPKHGAEVSPEDVEFLCDTIEVQSAEINTLRTANKKLADEVTGLSMSASMACEAPADDCDCAGCLTAREVYDGS